MKKNILLIIVIILLSNTFIVNAFELSRPATFKGFRSWIDKTKDDQDKQISHYIGFSRNLYRQRDFEDAIKVIDEFSSKYPNNEYIDDFQWLKGQICRYHLHRYKDYIDISVDLIEKYDGVKLDRKNNYPWEKIFPEEITRVELENELNDVKKSLNAINKIKEDIRDEKQKKDRDENTIINRYLMIGNIWRKLYDFDNAEKDYLAGTKEFPDNIKTAELFYEMGETFSNDKDLFDFMRLSINKNMEFRFNRMMFRQETNEEYWDNFDYQNENYKKAVNYYLEVYKKYPKSNLAPKALEHAGYLYTRIGWEWQEITDTKELDIRPNLSLPDYAKAAEIYEKIWREYPGYEKLKKILENLKNVYVDLKRSGKISQIECLKRELDVDKEIYKNENIQWDKDKRKILLDKAEKYKELYNEYPKVDLPIPNMDMEIEKIEELIDKKIEEKEGK